MRDEFKSREGEDEWSRYIIWSSDQDVKTWWDNDPGVKRPSSLSRALGGAVGVSGGSALTVPSILLPLKIYSSVLSDMESANSVVEEKVNNIESFRIDGKVSDRSVSIWIDKKRYVVLRLVEKTEFKDFKTESTTTYEPVGPGSRSASVSGST